MTTVGVVFRPQSPPERLRDVAQAAEAAGVAELWLWEDCFFEGGLTAATAVLAWTERLHVAVGLLPVPLRNPALAAMEAATLGRLFPGRFALGLGHGVLDWMAQVGARVDSPMTLLREHTAAVCDLLRGERVTVEGRYVRLDDVALDWPPPQAPPVLVGARGPRTLRLAGEIADGVVIDAARMPERPGARRGRARGAQRPVPGRRLRGGGRHGIGVGGADRRRGRGVRGSGRRDHGAPGDRRRSRPRTVHRRAKRSEVRGVRSHARDAREWKRL